MRARLFALVLLAAAFGASATQARAEQDYVQFFNNITIPADQTAHDTVCFFCNVENHGTINGDTVVFFGNVHINGKNEKDVVNFFGTTTAEDDSTIGGNLVNFFGGAHLGENTNVGRDIVCMFGGLHAAATATNGGSRLVQPAWFFWGPLAIFIVILYVIVHEIRIRQRRRLYMAGYPYPPQPPRP